MHYTHTHMQVLDLSTVSTHTHALYTYTQVLGLDPTNAAAYGNYAMLLWEDDRNISAAAELFRCAINACKTREERAPYLTNYAALIENSDPSELLNQAGPHKSPDDRSLPFTWADLSVCGCSGDSSDTLAEAWYRKAVESDGMHAPSLYNLAVFLSEVVDK